MTKVAETPMIKNAALLAWVGEMEAMCQPDNIYWCDGSEEENQRLLKQAVQQDELEELNQTLMPGCYYGRSQENDVARVENLTFICTTNKRDAGPTNNWMAPKEAYDKLANIYRGSMKGRTMYVIPFIMGIPGSSFSKIGIELSDSITVVLNMRIMTRMGKIALKELGDHGSFTKGLHSKADISLERRFICHFPEDNTIWSVGSNYGGNVLLGKKCLALRIASWLGKTEGWFAEHMLITGIQNPQGEIKYIAAAFPSQCGKTNLAMLVPPKSMKGYKVWTVGDDIAWLRVGSDGRLWAVNPEAGFFGVAPGTNSKTNPNAMETVKKNTIFTNVAKLKDGTVWWEGHDNPAPAEAIDWKGKPWTPVTGTPAAHPNARFTAPARQCPAISSEWENPQGVPLSAIIFGGRRAKLAPLVYQAFNWQHGVFVGATMASETTAAAAGAVGQVRRDPMAMLPFCGYNVGDYFKHWLSMGPKIKNAPKIFHVNWFRKNAEGKIVWPGYGENLRVLQWIINRAENKVEAEKTPIGWMPKAEDISLEGIDFSKEQLKNDLLSIDKQEWLKEVDGLNEFFQQVGEDLPKEIRQEQEELKKRLS